MRDGVNSPTVKRKMPDFRDRLLYLRLLTKKILQRNAWMICPFARPLRARDFPSHLYHGNYLSKGYAGNDGDAW